VLPEIDCHNAHQFAEKIRRIVEITDFRFEGVKIDVTISLGVAALDQETTDALGWSNALMSTSMRPRTRDATACGDSASPSHRGDDGRRSGPLAASGLRFRSSSTAVHSGPVLDPPCQRPGLSAGC